MFRNTEEYQSILWFILCIVQHKFNKIGSFLNNTNEFIHHILYNSEDYMYIYGYRDHQVERSKGDW